MSVQRARFWRMLLVWAVASLLFAVHVIGLGWAVLVTAPFAAVWLGGRGRLFPRRRR